VHRRPQSCHGGSRKFFERGDWDFFHVPKNFSYRLGAFLFRGEKREIYGLPKKLAIEVRVGFLVFLETSDFLVVADGFWEAAGNL
jgi:hypothetical protein